MARYIFSKNPDSKGVYEIHKKHECDHLPNLKDQIKLGDFSSYSNALFDAKRNFPDKNLMDVNIAVSNVITINLKGLRPFFSFFSKYLPALELHFHNT